MVKQNFSGRFLVFLPIVLTFIIYFASTTSRAVTDYDEGFYAQAAQHMVESGNWVTPYANGVRFLEKPPLLYWVTAVSFKIFGINEFALRLPTAFAVIALVWIVVLIVRKLSDEKAALAAGLSTAFSIGTYIFTRETLHDIWLVLFIAVAMYAFLNWYLDPRHSLKPALVFYAAIAGAVLCKSIIGAVFPLGIVVVFFLLSKKWPKWRTLHVLPGFLLFSLLTVPWHLLAVIQNKGFLEYFFVGEQFMRFLGKHVTVGSVPLAVFWVLILVWFFPWTAFLPAAFARVRKNPDENQRILVKLASAWAMVILGFFSVSARLEHYVFPAIPALSLFVGVALHKNEESKSVSWAFRGLAILGILLAIIGAVTGIWFATGGDFGSLSTNPSDRAGSTDFTILANMPLEIMLELIHPAWITIASIALGFGIAFRFEVHRRRVHALICVAVVMAVIFGMTNWSLRICEDLISSKKFALAIERGAHTAC
jgi:4-amino-4-deoxy-L-arabinose transferase-like glycosyltransferase